MRTAPSACLARRPVSKMRGLPLMVTDSRTKWDMALRASIGVIAAPCDETRARRPPLILGSRAPGALGALVGTNRRAKGRAAGSGLLFSFGRRVYKPLAAPATRLERTPPLSS